MKVLVSKAGELQRSASLCFAQSKKMFDVVKLLHAVYPHNVTIICLNNMANTFSLCFLFYLLVVTWVLSVFAPRWSVTHT